MRDVTPADEFELEGQLEPPLDEDTLRVVLHPSGRARCRAPSTAPRFAVAALLVLGTGASIRVFRSRTNEDYARVRRHGISEIGLRAERRTGAALSPAHPQTSRLRYKPGSPRIGPRVLQVRRDRSTSSTRIDGGLAVPAVREPLDGVADIGGTPHVDPASTPRTKTQPSVVPRRAPCVPGTLGC